ncbi:MAG: tRNA 2-thiouridine(34) synthase MnmA [Ignavibacteria bacterium]
MSKKNKKTVVAAMSGGVDSSVAAALLQREGYIVIGVTMKTWGYDEIPERDSGCCSLETIYDARNVANKLGIHHYTVDFTERFNDTVVTNFIEEYLKGRTPNPCVLCNKVIKWGALLEKAESLGADHIATGHYAKINFNEETQRYFISASDDKTKDQSYALWQVSQNALSRTLFPLGTYRKTEIRKMAKELGLKSADTPDSQEICFVPNNNYRELLQFRIPDLQNKVGEGDIIYHNKKIGMHKGYPFYTIGQRRGLNISLGKPVYVSKIDPQNNIIYVDDPSGLYNRAFIANNINLMLYEKIDKPMEARVKIRYKDNGAPAIIEQLDISSIKVIFDTPKRSITPGQSAVFYRGDDIIGGGTIDAVLE